MASLGNGNLLRLHVCYSGVYRGFGAGKDLQTDSPNLRLQEGRIGFCILCCDKSDMVRAKFCALCDAANLHFRFAEEDGRADSGWQKWLV